MNFHTDLIRCPKCNEIQKAKVYHTMPFYIYVHTCVKCNYSITEDEWVKVNSTRLKKMNDKK